LLSDESLLNLRFSVKGVSAEAEIFALTPDTVRLKIDSKAPWDAEALRCLSSVLEMLAKTLPFRPHD